MSLQAAMRGLHATSPSPTAAAASFELFRQPAPPLYACSMRRSEAFDVAPAPAAFTASRPSRAAFPWELRRAHMNIWSK